mmetsp:Transcript_6901/g.19187  ORF Transcript_6901/g.19187 Transcript_6901/m.19187 type:complete len:211 (-) Transcript_6901:27-659(-)
MRRAPKACPSTLTPPRPQCGSPRGASAWPHQPMSRQCRGVQRLHAAAAHHPGNSRARPPPLPAGPRGPGGHRVGPPASETDRTCAPLRAHCRDNQSCQRRAASVPPGLQRALTGLQTNCSRNARHLQYLCAKPKLSQPRSIAAEMAQTNWQLQDSEASWTTEPKQWPLCALRTRQAWLSATQLSVGSPRLPCPRPRPAVRRRARGAGVGN